jgi:hypothetical protein
MEGKLRTEISQGNMDEQDLKQKGQRNISFLEQKKNTHLHRRQPI